MARLFAALAVVAVVAGGLLALRSFAPREDAGALASAPPQAPSTAVGPLIVRVPRDKAIATVRGRGKEIFRADRIDAKLTTVAELGKNAGAAWGTPSASVVWAVAVGGDVAPANFDAPGRPYHWALYSVDAASGQVAYVNAGPESWPPFFDALADHPVDARGPGSTAPPLPAARRLGIPTVAGAYVTELRRLVSVAGPGGRMLYAVFGTRVRGASATTWRPFASADGGATWGPVEGVQPGLVDLAAFDRTVVIAGDAQPGLRVSTDGGATWTFPRGRDAEASALLAKPFLSVHAIRRADGRPLVLAEQPASGPSTILASLDGLSWRVVGTIPGRVVFGESTTPLISSPKSAEDAMYRVQGDSLDSLTLVQVHGSPRATAIAEDPASHDLWAVTRAPTVLYRSSDGGRSWTASRGTSDEMISRPVFLNGRTLAFGASFWWWDGEMWVAYDQAESWLLGVVAKVNASFQTDDAIYLFDNGAGLWQIATP